MYSKAWIFFLCFIGTATLNGTFAQEAADTSYLYKHQVAIPNAYGQINDVVVDSSGRVYIIFANNVVQYDGERYKTLIKVDLVHNDFIRGGVQNDKLFIYDYFGRFFYCEEDSIYAYPYNNLLVENNPFHELIDFKVDSADNLHVSFINSSYLIIDKNGSLQRPLIERGIQPAGYICLLDENNDPFFIGSQARTPAPKDTFFLMNSSYEMVDKVKASIRNYKLPSSGVRAGKYYHFSTGRGQLIHFNEKKIEKVEEVGPKITRLYSSGNNVWVSLFGVGVLRFSKDLDLSQDRIQLYQGRNLIASAIDFESNCWSYEPDGKVYQLSLNPPFYLPKINKILVQKWISSIDLSDSLLLVNTRDSLFQFKLNKEALSVSNFKLPPSSDRVPKIITNDKMIYLSYRGELYSKEVQSSQWKKLELPQEIFKFHHDNPIYLYRLIINNEKRVFATHNRYLFEVIDQNKIYVYPPFQRNIFDVLSANDQLVIKTESDLLVGSEEGFESLYNTFPSLKGRQLNLSSTGEILWISSVNDGLYYLKNGKLEELKLKGASITNGKLIDRDSMEVLCISDQGLISLKTLVEKDSIIAQTHPQIQFFNYSLHSSNKDQLVWISREGGLHFKKFDELYNPIAPCPPLQIELLINGREKYSGTGEIDPFHNYLQLRFKSQLLSIGKSYRYRIPGMINDWHTTDQDLVQFANVNSGKYEVEAQQRMNKNAWSRSNYYSFEVGIPFFKSWWFIVLIIAVFVTIIWFIINWQVRFQTLQREHELDRLRSEQLLLRSQMSPHFISNVLSSLHYLILKNMNKEADKFISSFSLLMRRSYQYSRQEQVSLKDEIEFIEEYLQLQKMRLEGDLEYKINSRGMNITQESIPTFILQPIVENAIHHGLKGKKGLKKIDIEIASLKPGEILIKVEDNGIGFSNSLGHILKEKKVKSSLFVIMERLEIINQRQNGNLEIERIKRSDDEFTVITLKIQTKRI